MSISVPPELDAVPSQERDRLAAAMDRVLPGRCGPGAADAAAIEAASFLLAFRHRSGYVGNLRFGLALIDDLAH